MKNNKIKYFPVGNGDQSLIILEDETTIMIDCNIRKDSIDNTDSKMYDVKKDILNCMQKRGNNYYTDVFILTHGDCDHCRGFEEHFYQGHPSKYSDKNRKANEIIIDEMWFSPMIAEEHKNSDEEVYQKEAERRIELHLKNDQEKDAPGNRIRIIGYDGNKDYSKLDKSLRSVPGDIVTRLNGKVQDTFSIFIHSPFKELLAPVDGGEKDKNSTSIVFQARFKKNASAKGNISLAMFGGDSDYIAWEIINAKTIESGKDISEEALDWDLFLAPHHCSWSFFNEHDNKYEPKEIALEILRHKRTGGIVISSSKKIINNDDNPPSYLAKQQYVKEISSASNFLNTDIEPTENAPEPIVFLITENGPAREKNTKVNSATSSAGGVGAASIITKQG